jgi:uncharacterized protein YabE (DUF348 family)
MTQGWNHRTAVTGAPVTTRSSNWNPRKLAHRRMLRIFITAVVVSLVCIASFLLNVRKTIALEVNGETRTVETYASSVDRLLEEEGISTKTHDQVESSSGDWLADHAVVTVRSAYQVTLTIDGKKIPYWTVAKSMSQLAGFFESSQKDAAKITVNVSNVYNQLTGGLVINQDGPVTVLADGKETTAPNGKLTAASILDSKGITLGKEDRVGVEKKDAETILRVQRVTHGTTTRTTTVSYQKITVEDPTLYEGTTQVQQKGANGTKTDTLSVTYVDGKAESEVVTGSVTSKMPVDEIIAVGTKKKEVKKDTDTSDNNDDNSGSSGSSDSSNSNTDKKSSKDSSADSDSKTKSGKSSGSTKKNSGSSESSKKSTTTKKSTGSSNSSSKSKTKSKSNSSSSSSSSKNTSSSSSNSSGHLTASEAKSLARGMARDFYGWGDSQYNCLVTLWNNESGWRWNADNPWSDAYGIPQALPGSKMGTGWKDNAAVQIQWGLSYIKNRYDYGTPCKALKMWNSRNPHWY